MATHNWKMLGRTQSSGGPSCRCCNKYLTDKSTARRREERRWRADADRELNNRAKAE